jgi:hypothetical protein
VQVASGTPSSQPPDANTSTPGPGITPGRTPGQLLGTATGIAPSPTQSQATPQPSAPVETGEGISTVAVALLVGSLLIGLGLILGWLRKRA